MTDAPALPAPTCKGCDWFRYFDKAQGISWCVLHDERMRDDEPACEYRRELEDDE